MTELKKKIAVLSIISKDELSSLKTNVAGRPNSFQKDYQTRSFVFGKCVKKIVKTWVTVTLNCQVIHEDYKSC